MTLEELRASLGNGPAWFTGNFAKRLLDVIIADRARLMPSAGNEIVEADGRWFDILAGSGGAGLDGFKITAAADGKVRIKVSLIAGAIPDGFTADDSTPFLLDVADGDDIYLTVAWDATSETPGAVLTRTAHAGEVPADDKPNATFSYRIGHVTVTGAAVKVTQYRYGPISTEVVRDWAKTPKEFAASNQ